MKFEELQKAKIEAMKEKNNEKKDAISAVIESAKKTVIDAGGDRTNIPDDIVNKAILKEIKTIDEQIASCPADRADLKDQFAKRKSYIEAYAPKMMTKDEVMKIINEKYADVVATKQKGQIMKAVMPEFKGKADGKMINEIIESLCQ